MEVVIWPVTPGRYQAIKTDAISCTYDMDGFTPMNAVVSQLGLDPEHFRKCGHMHAGGKFRVISHGDEKPFVITITKTEQWDSQLDAAEQILNTADAERCESLCMTHFAFILGVFPEEAFAEYMLQLEQAKGYTGLTKAVVDVDSRYIQAARKVHQRVKSQLAEAEPGKERGNDSAGPYRLILGLGSPAQQLILSYRSEALKDDDHENLHIAAKDAHVTGLDGSDFDRAELQALLDGAVKVLVVVCAGGWAGAEMAKFAVQHAVTKKIPVDALLSKPFAWEGRRRQTRALSLAEDLRAKGAKVIVVESAIFDTDDRGWEEQFMQLDAAMLNEVAQWSLERA